MNKTKYKSWIYGLLIIGIPCVLIYAGFTTQASKEVQERKDHMQTLIDEYAYDQGHSRERVNKTLSTVIGQSHQKEIDQVMADLEREHPSLFGENALAIAKKNASVGVTIDGIKNNLEMLNFSQDEIDYAIEHLYL